jgi:hypothetical protein
MRNPRNNWDEGGYEEEPPSRSSAGNRRRPSYKDVDLERALVPSQNAMLPMDPSGLGMGAGLPAIPGLPQTDEEERAIGIRRPVYIPATGEKRKKKLGTWRILSGVVSIMLICIAGCGAAALLGHNQIAGWIKGPVTVVHTVQAYSTANVPVTPIATPGSQTKYVFNIVTSAGVSTNFVPINETSHFQVGQYVYVVCDVHGIPKGQKHTISIHWFYDGQDLGLQSNLGGTYQTVDSNQVVYFRLNYPYPGLGMAKVFFDLPSTDSGDQANDPYLAGQIYFAVDPAGAGTPSGTGTP